MQRHVALVLVVAVLEFGSSVAWAQTPTPTPTPPSCSASPCGGTCAVLPPCTPGTACPQFAIQGSCELDASGACTCVATSFPTPTPAPTFTPACAGTVCGGSCELCPPCVQFGCELPCEVGTCELDASGACSCAPFTPPATLTPTPTPAPPSGCLGDCGGTHAVTVADLVTLVDVALGIMDASACPQGIPPGVPVDVLLIVQAVNNLLEGCPGAPSPTPAETPTVCPTGTPCSQPGFAKSCSGVPQTDCNCTCVPCPLPPCAYPLIGQCTSNGITCSCSCVPPTPTPTGSSAAT